VNEPHERTPPGDPWNITLTYQHGHRWWFDADTAPETWHVSADIHDDSGTHVEAHVGDMNIVIVDIYDTHDPFGLLDGEEADLGLIAEVIFDAGNGRLAPDLDERLQPLGSRILILNSVRLTPEWRGLGLGVLLTGTAIKKLSSGVRAAVCYPAPIDELTSDELDDSERQLAIAALDRVWAKLGFEHLRDGIHVLDLNLVTLDEHLGQLRKSAERYRTLEDRD